MNLLLNNNKAAIYCRLSQEDGLDDVSHSIISQVEICEQYLNEHHLNLIKIYKDDGYTGSNYDRPAFKELIEDIKLKRVNVVITKDLSRLGRNLLGSGYYLDDFFPNNQIRYISVNDNYDSAISSDDNMLALKNYINELYVKECIKKSKLQITRRSKTKNMASTGIYGYITEHGITKIDPETAPIVKEIFDRVCNLEPHKKIINDLNGRGVLSPYEYRVKRLNMKRVHENKGWTISAINDIIRSKQYTGSIVNLRYHKGLRNKNTVEMEDSFEAIITKEQFDKALSIRQNRRKEMHITDDNRLKSYFYLDGKPLRYHCHMMNGKPLYEYYRDSYGKGEWKASMLHETVYDYCVSILKKVIKEKSVFMEEQRKNMNTESLIKRKSEISKEINQITFKYKKLFESKIEGLITDLDYELKTDILKNSEESLKNELNQIEVSLFKNNEREKNLIHYVNKLKGIDTSIKPLDLIRTISKRCNISLENKQMKLEIELYI